MKDKTIYIHAEARLRKLARDYADAYGEKLISERDALDADGYMSGEPYEPQSEHAAEQRALNALDARMTLELARERRARRKRVIGAISGIAAALVILLLSTPLIRASTPPVASEQAPAAAETEAAAAPSEPQATSLPAPTPAYVAIPLSFPLTPNLSVAEVLQDKEKTVYKLLDSNLDDVVLTLHYASAPETEGLREILLNSTKAYAKYSPDYSLLTFSRDGLVYTMTCRHDLNTLLALGRNVVL